MKTDPELQKEGFTASGILRYAKTAREYCDQLFTRSIAQGEYDKAPDAQREVTHEHVRAAAESLSRRRQETSWLQIGCQIGEYLCAIGTGVGGGKLDQSWGVLLLVSAAVLGVILFIIRITQNR